MNSDNTKRSWPPVPGDFEVGNPEKSVAVCTLGKKLKVDADYCIIGTCKTENIGIERVIVNVVSNPHIRYLILCGPEVPGHHTGSSMKSLYDNGIDEATRKIIDAKGAIPYIENIPPEAVERFRNQVTLIDMRNNSDTDEIAAAVADAEEEGRPALEKGPMWIEFGTRKKPSTVSTISGDISLLPEFGVSLNPSTTHVERHANHAKVTLHPSSVVVDMREDEDGTILVGKEE